MTEETKYATAGDILEKTTKDVTGPSGSPYKIRRVTPLDYLSAGSGIPLGDLLDDIDGMDASDAERAIMAKLESADTEQMAALLRVSICAAVVSINVVMEGPSDPETNTLNVDSLPPEDILFLGDAISDFSASSLARVGIAPKFFREDQRQVGASDGEDVPSDAAPTTDTPARDVSG